MKREMFRKLMAASLATVMVAGLAGCGNSAAGASGSGSAAGTPAGTGSQAASGAQQDVEPYPVLTDANGNVYDLGGMEIIIRDWFSPATENGLNDPTNDYEEARLEYLDWIQEKYNFKIKREAIGDWGSNPQDFVDYVTAGGDEKNYVFVLRNDPTVTSAMGKGYMWDLTQLDSLDFSENKFQLNKLHERFALKDHYYAMATGYPEPRDGIFFNKTALTEAGITNPDSLYDMQADGTWTWDKWTEIMDQVQRDVDNDGTLDIYGTTQNNGQFAFAAVYSNGAELVGKDADGKFVYKAENAETVAGLEFAVKVMTDYAVKFEDGAAWDAYKNAFKSGQAAFMCEQAYNMNNGSMLYVPTEKDKADGTGFSFDYGFVFFPKGPNATGYTNVWEDNAHVIPSCYDKERANKIAFAYNLYTEDIPGYENYKAALPGYLAGACDTRTVYETCDAMLTNGFVTYHGVVPDLVTTDLQWQIYAGAVVSEKLEAIRESWNTAIDAANSKNEYVNE
ncbi:MAG: hypothetical protein ACI4HQ_07945 [Acetatifactor sp.]